MKEVFIGEYIKRRRQELGLRQRDLCDGICEPVTMSRLENGKQYSSSSVINALLQRLDLSAEHYIAVLSDHEIKIENLREDINALMIQFQLAAQSHRHSLRERIWEKIEELEDLVGDDEDRINRQFILRVKVYLGTREGGQYTPEEKLALLLEALRVTVPKFELDNIGGFFYSLDEVKIINNISGAFSDLGQMETLADILGQLFEYLQKHARNILQGRGHLQMVACNYARALNLCGRNKEALEVAEFGRQACIKYRNYQSLPRIIHTMAVTHHDMGNEKISTELYHQAYYLCKTIDDQSALVLLRQDAKEHWGIEFQD